MRIISTTVFLTFLLLSCSEGGGKSTALLPKASGKPGEMIIVMDSKQWKGDLGTVIKSVFLQEAPGLPREEYMFKANHVEPQKLNSILKSVKNLVFLVTLDSYTPGSKLVKSYFTKSSIDQIENDPDLYVYTSSDVFARGQNVMYLFGKDEQTLLSNIQKNKQALQNYFNKAEKDRLTKGLYKAKESKGFNDLLIKDHQCSMRIPFGYKLVANDSKFIWFRQINDESDKNVFITYKNYISEDIFKKENLITLRDSITSTKLFEDPANQASFILTETKVPYIPVEHRQVNFNGGFGIEMRGLWKTNNFSMGGPFISYSLVDEELGRIYYIEGFIYSPGKNQREFIREMEVILSTFKTKGQLQSPPA